MGDCWNLTSPPTIVAVLCLSASTTVKPVETHPITTLASTFVTTAATTTTAVGSQRDSKSKMNTDTIIIISVAVAFFVL
ncbi:hypothetical protein OESDEN_11266, partial [Oesophagostomum dentatum]